MSEGGNVGEPFIQAINTISQVVSSAFRPHCITLHHIKYKPQIAIAWHSIPLLSLRAYYFAWRPGYPPTSPSRRTKNCTAKPHCVRNSQWPLPSVKDWWTPVGQNQLRCWKPRCTSLDSRKCWQNGAGHLKSARQHAMISFNNPLRKLRSFFLANSIIMVPDPKSFIIPAQFYLLELFDSICFYIFPTITIPYYTTILKCLGSSCFYIFSSESYNYSKSA